LGLEQPLTPLGGRTLVTRERGHRHRADRGGPDWRESHGARELPRAPSLHPTPSEPPSPGSGLLQSASTSSGNGLGTAPGTGSVGGGGGWNPSGGSISMS
jgi:hypothetical protein